MRCASRVARLVARLLLLSLPPLSSCQLSSTIGCGGRSSSSFDESVDTILAQLPRATGTSNATIHDELVRVYSQPDVVASLRWEQLGLTIKGKVPPQPTHKKLEV